MLQRFLNSFKSDCRYIIQNPVLLAAVLYPLIIILLLRFAVNPVSDLIFLKAGFRLGLYYTIIAITIISVIPALLGFIHAFIYLDKHKIDIFNVVLVTPADNKITQFFKMIIPALLCFIIVLTVNLITNPVPTEGWLRSVFVSLLLSVQSPFVLLLIGSFANSRAKAILLLKIYGILLAAVPLGLLLHHPWNYFLFFSPYYWISWAWVSYSPVESLIYGVISTGITIGFILWFYTHLLKK
jgi:hypothetical protein